MSWLFVVLSDEEVELFDWEDRGKEYVIKRFFFEVTTSGMNKTEKISHHVLFPYGRTRSFWKNYGEMPLMSIKAKRDVTVYYSHLYWRRLEKWWDKICMNGLASPNLLWEMALYSLENSSDIFRLGYKIIGYKVIGERGY